MVHFSILGVTIDSEEATDNILWLQLLRLFPTVQTLFVSWKIAGRVACVLEEIAGVIMVTEVLPVLELLCLEQQLVSSVDKFIAVRRDSGHPVTRVNVVREFFEGLLTHRR
jgi:hypothetical protein